MTRRILICAGEPSGEKLGAELIDALRRMSPEPLEFAGVGGEAMAAQGVESLFPLSDVAVMGLAEVVGRIRLVLRRVRDVADFAARWKPDAVVTIDSLDLSTRIANRVRKAAPDTVLMHYVAPKLWAWRPGRAKRLRVYDAVLALLPFEPAFFAQYGITAHFVGHPVVNRLPPSDAAATRARLGIAADAPLAVMLPGSRMSEVTRLFPVFAETMTHLAARHPGLTVVIPTVPTVADFVRQAAAAMPVPARVVEGEANRYAVYRAADVALAASGTVSLELMAAGTPMVIAYRVAAASAFLAPYLIKVKWVTLLNIMLDREAVPERLQQACTPDRLVADLEALLTPGPARDAQLAAFREGLDLLGAAGPPPAERTAERVLLTMGLAPVTA